MVNQSRPARLARVEHGEDVRMLQPGGQLDLALEPLGAERGGQLGMEHLEATGACGGGPGPGRPWPSRRGRARARAGSDPPSRVQAARAGQPLKTLKWEGLEDAEEYRRGAARARRGLQEQPNSCPVLDRTFLRLEFVFFDAGPSRSLKFPSRRSRARRTRPLLHHPVELFRGGVCQKLCQIGYRNGAKPRFWTSHR